ncbi:unnamed protein product [[Candida] boidinii]|nr:unnamed protein product [[Candida] boidinii]
MADYFPWDKIVAYSPAPPFEDGIGAKPTGDHNTTVTELVKHQVEEYDVPLARSLQYGYTQGQPELIKFIKEHTELIHKLPYEDWDAIISVGNTQSWEAVLRTFVNKQESILVEEYTFSSAIETARALDVNFVPVPMDAFGIIPEKLDELLDNWDESKQGKKPKLLYTIATGQNPTGSSLSNERRAAIYKTACKHDFIILNKLTKNS